MTLAGTGALKFAVSKADVWTWPRSTLYGFVKREAAVTEAPFSGEVARRVGFLSEEKRFGSESPLTRVLRHDIGEVSKALGKVDPAYDPDHLMSLTDDVNSFLEGELDAKAPEPLRLSIVDRYPHPYEKAKATAWSLSKFESELLGMPQGVYMRRDQIFPVSAECILGHEYGHAVILDMPNYVPWLDEGLADILGYAYYASRFGEVGDLRAWFNFRSEMKEYGRWYAEYDRLAAALVLSCGMEPVKALVRLKRHEPSKVEWTRLSEVLRTSPTYREVRACVEGEFPEATPLSPLYASLAALLCSPDLVYTLSPEAYVVILNLMDGGKEKDDAAAYRGVPVRSRPRAEKELFDHNLVYRRGRKIGIFGGDYIGSEGLLRSGLVRAEVGSSSLRGFRRASGKD